jgi:2-dehydro-3-deoxygluconokinase
VSASAAAATLEALQVAARLNCKVSLDLNYRAKLWSPEAARRTLTPMMEYVHILITTMGDSQTILGVDAGDEDELSRVLLDRFPLEVTALSIREGDGVLRCRFSAMARTRAGIFTARRYDIDIIDQLGRGDSFAAGFLYGYLRCGGVQPGLDYGVAFAALKHSSPGDINWCTRQEVEDLLAGPRPGVSR